MTEALASVDLFDESEEVDFNSLLSSPDPVNQDPTLASDDAGLFDDDSEDFESLLSNPSPPKDPPETASSPPKNPQILAFGGLEVIPDTGLFDDDDEDFESLLFSPPEKEKPVPQPTPTPTKSVTQLLTPSSPSTPKIFDPSKNLNSHTTVASPLIPRPTAPIIPKPGGYTPVTPKLFDPSKPIQQTPQTPAIIPTPAPAAPLIPKPQIGIYTPPRVGSAPKVFDPSKNLQQTAPHGPDLLTSVPPPQTVKPPLIPRPQLGAYTPPKIPNRVADPIKPSPSTELPMGGILPPPPVTTANPIGPPTLVKPQIGVYTPPRVGPLTQSGAKIFDPSKNLPPAGAQTPTPSPAPGIVQPPRTGSLRAIPMPGAKPMAPTTAAPQPTAEQPKSGLLGSLTGFLSIGVNALVGDTHEPEPVPVPVLVPPQGTPQFPPTGQELPRPQPAMQAPPPSFPMPPKKEPVLTPPPKGYALPRPQRTETPPIGKTRGAVRPTSSSDSLTNTNAPGDQVLPPPRANPILPPVALPRPASPMTTRLTTFKPPPFVPTPPPTEDQTPPVQSEPIPPKPEPIPPKPAPIQAPPKQHTPVIDEPVPDKPAAMEEKQAPKAQPATAASPGWGTWLWTKVVGEKKEGGPKEMKMGQPNSFYYNNELQMWVEAGKEEEYAKRKQRNAAPPTDSELKKEKEKIARDSPTPDTEGDNSNTKDSLPTGPPTTPSVGHTPGGRAKRRYVDASGQTVELTKSTPSDSILKPPTPLTPSKAIFSPAKFVPTPTPEAELQTSSFFDLPPATLPPPDPQPESQKDGDEDKDNKEETTSTPNEPAIPPPVSLPTTPITFQKPQLSFRSPLQFQRPNFQARPPIPLTPMPPILKPPPVPQTPPVEEDTGASDLGMDLDDDLVFGESFKEEATKPPKEETEETEETEASKQLEPEEPLDQTEPSEEMDGWTAEDIDV